MTQETDNSIVFKKQLSHRLRGFGEFESSPSALKNACKSQIAYLEIDTRVSRDGEIYLHHDPYTGKNFTKKLNLAQTSSKTINETHFINGEKILTLADALKAFAARKNKSQKLCIDIKDFGYEVEHLQVVREHNMEDQVVFVSWIPQTLLKLADLGTASPLILSHINTLKFKAIGALIAKFTSRLNVSLHRYVVLGGKTYTDALVNTSKGFQHGIILHEIPAPLLDVLSSSGGGICVHKKLISRETVSYCKKNSLALWGFSVADKQEYCKLASHIGVDVVFCEMPIT